MLVEGTLPTRSIKIGLNEREGRGRRKKNSVYCTRVEIGRKLICVLVEGTLPTGSIKIGLNERGGRGRRK